MSVATNISVRGVAVSAPQRSRIWPVIRIVIGATVALLFLALLVLALRAMFDIEPAAFKTFQFEPETAYDANGRALCDYAWRTGFPFGAPVMSVILMAIASLSALGVLIAFWRFSLRVLTLAVLCISAVGVIPLLYFSADRHSTLRLVMVTRTPLPAEKLKEIEAALQPSAALDTLPQDTLNELALQPEDRPQRVTVAPAIGSNGKAAFSCCVVFKDGIDNWKKAALVEFYECYTAVLDMEATGLKGDPITQSYSMTGGVMAGSVGRSNNSFWSQHQQRWMALRQSGWKPDGSAPMR